ncbi:hypothetical protein [Priestia megaterium]|uniref:hypothetical protein n=1 Tax=Priestia megaterium TaxID=1404 RepID=UPI001868F191|nr:hypothetical protein [Priestia megaterium]MBE2977793.1 hypothetical protein [Priestia megaterium]
MKFKLLSKKEKRSNKGENHNDNIYDIITFFEDLLKNDKHTEIRIKLAKSNEKDLINYLDESLKLANDLIYLLSRKISNNYLHMRMIHELIKLSSDLNYAQKKIRERDYQNLEIEVFARLSRHFKLIDKIYLTMEEATKNYDKYELVFKDEIRSIQWHFKNNLKLFPVKYDLSHVV